MRKILVSGCLGTVAIFTINYILDNFSDIEIIGFDNLSSNPIERKEKIIKSNKFTAYYGQDVSGYLRKIFALNEIDYILHLAADTSISATSDNPLTCVDNNISLTLELLEYARKYNVKKIVFASSSSVYGEILDKDTSTEYVINGFDEEAECQPISNYAITKLTSEQFIKQYHRMYGINYVILRYNNILANIEYIGKHKPFVAIAWDKIVNGEILTLNGNGEIMRQYTNVHDIVTANLFALFNEDLLNNTFNISGQKALSLNKIVEYLLTYIYHYDIFDKIVNKLDKISIWNGTYFDTHIKFNPSTRKDDIFINYVDSRKYRKITGIKEMTDVYDTLDSYFDWRFKKNAHF